MSVEAVDEVVQLLLADVRRRTATKVGEAQLAALKSMCAAIALHLFDEGVQIELNLAGILVRINFEVTKLAAFATDRKSTRLNSSHLVISYAVFCLKKKNGDNTPALNPSASSHHELILSRLI